MIITSFTTMSVHKLCLLAALFPLTLGLVGCGSSSLYSWYDYEQRTHAYTQSQSPERLAKLVETYKSLIERQHESRGVPPPGICAEYGYLLIKTGQRELGLKMLEREIELYPESKVFIQRIIQQAKS